MSESEELRSVLDRIEVELSALEENISKAQDYLVSQARSVDLFSPLVSGQPTEHTDTTSKEYLYGLLVHQFNHMNEYRDTLVSRKDALERKLLLLESVEGGVDDGE